MENLSKGIDTSAENASGTKRSCAISGEEALALLKKYNQDEFHLRHAFTVEKVMRYFAEQLGYGDEADYWAMVGLLHDIDFEQYPDEHCRKAPELLREAGDLVGLLLLLAADRAGAPAAGVVGAPLVSGGRFLEVGVVRLFLAV